MKKTYSYLLILMILFIGKLAFAQQQLSHEELQSEVEGTYQVRVINARFKPALNTNHYNLIIESRMEDEDVVLEITENIEVLVLSGAKLKKEELIDESQKIIYIRR